LYNKQELEAVLRSGKRGALYDKSVFADVSPPGRQHGMHGFPCRPRDFPKAKFCKIQKIYKIRRRTKNV